MDRRPRLSVLAKQSPPHCHSERTLSEVEGVVEESLLRCFDFELVTSFFAQHDKYGHSGRTRRTYTQRHSVGTGVLDCPYWPNNLPPHCHSERTLSEVEGEAEESLLRCFDFELVTSFFAQHDKNGHSERSRRISE